MSQEVKGKICRGIPEIESKCRGEECQSERKTGRKTRGKRPGKGEDLRQKARDGR